MEHFPVGGFFQELLRAGIYKQSQGRITRQVTFAAMAVVLLLGCYRLHQTMKMEDWIAGKMAGIEYWLPGLLALAGVWFSYRLVNIPRVADFLIAVEAEMNKVSWPTRLELFRASVVVLFCIIALAILLYGYDFVLSWVRNLILK
jgi:preprotein translocase subunit SecE